MQFIRFIALALSIFKHYSSFGECFCCGLASIWLAFRILTGIARDRIRRVLVTKLKTLTVQRTIYLTPQMWDYLAQLARQRGRACTENVLIREALRLYIDQQADVLSSRKHFQKSLQDRFTLFENKLLQQSHAQMATVKFCQHVIMQLLAFGLAHLIAAVTRREVSAEDLLRRAIVEAQRTATALDAQISQAQAP